MQIISYFIFQPLKTKIEFSNKTFNYTCICLDKNIDLLLFDLYFFLLVEI